MERFLTFMWTAAKMEEYREIKQTDIVLNVRLNG